MNMVNTSISFDENKSTNVELNGTKYKAVAVIHHQVLGEKMAHHYSSLYNETSRSWTRVDDHHPRQRYKTEYQFSQTENAHTAEGYKLFDNMGIVAYKMVEDESNPEEPQINTAAEHEPQENVEP